MSYRVPFTTNYCYNPQNGVTKDSIISKLSEKYNKTRIGFVK